MRIWFAEIGEPLPMEADVRLHRVGNLTRLLAEAGHEITWWTCNFSHAPKKFVCEPGTYFPFPGCRLRVLPGTGYHRNVSAARFRHQADFARKLAASMQVESPPDVMVVGVPTLETAEIVIKDAQARGYPVLVDIRDEWPDEFVRLAPRHLQWIARLALAPLFRKMSRICRGATGVIGISTRQLDYGMQFAARSKGAFDGVFPLGYSQAALSEIKISAAKQWWIEQGIRPDALIMCFFGTLGPFFQIGTLIEGIRLLKKEFDVQLVVCGDGSHLVDLKRKAAGLENVLFPGWVDAPKIASLMSMSALGVAPYASDAPAFSLPNKPFEYMAGGLPVLSSIRGELRAILESCACGLSYEADDVNDFVEKARRLLSFPAERRAMGQRAHRLLTEEFRIESIASRLESHLNDVVKAFPRV